MIAKTIIRSILEFTGIDKIKKERKIKKRVHYYRTLVVKHYKLITM